MSNYNKVVVTTSTYSVTDMIEGSTPICDTKILSGSSWSFSSNELPATVYYETDSKVESSTTYDIGKHRVFINGEENEKFDFIENKVVQDGLIGSVFSSTPKTVKINKSSNYTIQFVGKYNQIHRIYSAIFGIYDTVVHFYMDSNSENKEELRLRAGDNIIYASSIVKNFNELFQETSNLLIELDVKNSLIKVNLNGISKQYSYTPKEMQETLNLYLLKTTIDNSNFDGEVKGLLVYDRALNQQEITRNFSVLNNAPAIKELHNTDSTGKTSILNFASDEDHVEMSTGRTLRQEYMGVLKTMGKEFVSDNGSPVEVNNGIEARVINAEVKGNTIKCYASRENSFNLSLENKFCWMEKAIPLDVSLTYKYRIECSGLIGKVVAFFIDGNVTIHSNGIELTNGVNEGTLSLKPTGWDVTKNIQLWPSGNTTSDGNISVDKVSVYVGEKINSYIPFGLSSTQAIISNNGQSYPIYEPTIKGKTRILDADTGLVPTDPTLPALKDGDVLDLATKTITFANKSTQVLTDEQVKAYDTYRKIITLNAI